MEAPREPTESEALFFGALSRAIPDLQDCYHRDNDGAPWMMVSFDVLDGRGVVATLRLDYDAHGIAGGWSPAGLNWDAEIRAKDVPIDTAGDGGLSVSTTSLNQAIAQATAWFERHIPSVRRDKA